MMFDRLYLCKITNYQKKKAWHTYVVLNILQHFITKYVKTFILNGENDNVCMYQTR